MTSWTAWGDCNVSCGNGYKSKNRQIIKPAEFGGTPCGRTTERMPCNLGPCGGMSYFHNAMYLK